MKRIYARNLSIITLITGCSSLFFYLLRGLMDMNFENPIPILIVTVPFILFGSLIFLQTKNDSKNIKISVLTLLILWSLLTILLIILIFVTDSSLLFIPLSLMIPSYAIYSSVKFLKVNYE